MKFVTTSLDHRGVATVTLNNPDKHNAFDDVVINELKQTFAELNDNCDVRVVVLASNGKSFSAGADLNWMKRTANYSREENLADAVALADMLKALNFMAKPTIARVQGATFGGGVGLVSCCDMAVAANRAVFSLSEAKIGMIPATIGPYVVAAIGQRAARRYFTTAGRFDAGEALNLGLVSQVVADEAALDAAIAELVEQLLTSGPAAVAAAKQLVFEVDGEITEQVISESCERIADIRVSAEGQEGLTAFLEKRSPAWVK
ncbi:enoyl-CoA hydratase/isomerase family protein [Oceanicoccus sagamiensis]|uniref:Gamma-carboxygeranoyl-CoA hydratase n=1 Tax=Oceanicoccus sagamiensis TaxID=716816 RepID=A0A1X9NQZ0_9GAMM|nr:enoyl-CoA hydratase/isomerase family protein [Oceanicoccus sagamiensis]ARN76223.1 gamma-carboxygeranoyl-CoA hydratase [Oceanicoccus sagamiensis]